MRAVLIIIALLFIAGGGVFAYGGFAHRGTRFFSDSNPATVFDSVFAPVGRAFLNMGYDARAALQMPDNGMLIPFAIVGALLFVLGVVFLYSAKRMGDKRVQTMRESQGIKKEKAAISIEQLRGGESAKKKEEPGGGGGGGESGLEIDMSALDLEHELDFTDINILVSLAHSALEQEQREKTLKALRPELLPYFPQMSELAAGAVVKQVLDCTIVRHKRAEKDITADQFRLQDDNMNKLERETIGMRFMPSDTASDGRMDEKHRERVGKVFTMNEYAQLHQEMLTEADDWQDISLRNAIAVLGSRPGSAAPKASTAAASQPSQPPGIASQPSGTPPTPNIAAQPSPPPSPPPVTPAATPSSPPPATSAPTPSPVAASSPSPAAPSPSGESQKPPGTPSSSSPGESAN